MSAPEGLFFIKNAVPNSFCDLIEEWFNTEEIQNSLFSITKSEKSRKVLHYGYKYNYNSGDIKQKIEDFPHIIEILRDIVSEVWVGSPDNLSQKLNQCIINRYLPGQGIGKHIDSLQYGEIIVSFTFFSGRELEFTQEILEEENNPCKNKYWKRNKVHKIYTSPGSMYIMTGKSRYEWHHQMKPRYSDKNIPRKECFSITFREVK